MPCGSTCANVRGRCDYFVDDPLLVHVLGSEFHKVVMHTPETLLARTTQLKHSFEHAYVADHALEEKACGIKYSPDGIYWGEEVRKELEPPNCQYPDWMHIFVSHGGIAQYHLNAITLRSERARIYI